MYIYAKESEKSQNTAIAFGLEFLSKHLRRQRAVASDCLNSESSSEGQIQSWMPMIK